MEFSLCSQVGRKCFFCRIESAKKISFSFCRYIGAKFSALDVHAKITASGALFGSSSVLRVAGCSRFPKIFKPIVLANSVQVVKCAGWPCASDVEPRQTMSTIRLFVYVNLDVPLFGDTAGKFPRSNTWSLVYLPSEHPSVGIVMQDFLQIFLRKHIGSGQGSRGCGKALTRRQFGCLLAAQQFYYHLCHA